MDRPAKCPHCGEELDVPPELRGQEVRCAVCREVFRTPGGEMAPARRTSRRDDDYDDRPRRSPAPRASRDDDYDDDRNDRLDDRPRRPKKKSGMGWVWIMLAGLFFFCVLPCGGFFGFAAWLAFPNFKPYDAPDGKFRAEFPGDTFTFTRPTDPGTTETCVEFKRSFPPETYFVHYTDLPDKTVKAGSATVLKDAADRYVAKDPGTTETSRTSGTADGYASIDLSLQVNGDEAEAVVRLILVGNRLYIIGITSSSIDPSEPRVKHFFDAFKVKSAAPGVGGVKK